MTAPPPPTGTGAPVPERLASELVARYDATRRFAAVTADRDLDPDDLVQEAFTRVFRVAARSGEPPAHLDAYLRRTIVNLVANERRSRARGRAAARRLPVPDEGAVAEYPSHTAAVLDAAAPVDRALVHLVDIEGVAVAEAAHQVGLSSVAARSRLSRARRRLRAVLREDERRMS
jgi:RNA polymerase sigma-70 factor (ECF subfamily)